MGYCDEECVICAISGYNTSCQTQIITCLTCFVKINNLDTDRERAFMNRLTVCLKEHLCQDTCNYCKKFTLCFDTFMCKSCKSKIDIKNIREQS